MFCKESRSGIPCRIKILHFLTYLYFCNFSKGYIAWVCNICITYAKILQLDIDCDCLSHIPLFKHGQTKLVVKCKHRTKRPKVCCHPQTEPMSICVDLNTFIWLQSSTFNDLFLMLMREYILLWIILIVMRISKFSKLTQSWFT